MIKTVCDICLKEIPMQSKPQICEKHMEYAEQFYREQLVAVAKAADGFRNRFLQTVINKPRPVEVAK